MKSSINKKYALMATALFLIMGIGLVSAFPYQMKGFGLRNNLSDEEVLEMHSKNEEIRNAIESGDYESWKKLMQDRINLMQSQLSQENFDKLVDMHKERQEFRAEMEKARESGDFERMQNLRSMRGSIGMGKGLSNGLNENNCMGQGFQR